MLKLNVVVSNLISISVTVLIFINKSQLVISKNLLKTTEKFYNISLKEVRKRCLKKN